MRSISQIRTWVPRTLAGCLALVALVGAATAATHISGVINKISFEPGATYIVEQDIIIPPDVEVTIKEGTIFLFKPFTTFTIQGKLVVEGTPEKSVIFTSIYDSNYNPSSKQNANPFDWNGIVLTSESGGTIMNNFVLGYSVFGIKSQSPRITIRNGMFRQNGQYHFTINDRAQFVQDDIPFSYSTQRSDDGAKTIAASTSTPRRSTATQEEEPKAARDRVPRQKKIFRYTSFGVGIGGIALGTAMIVPWMARYSEIHRLNKENEQAKNNPDLTKTEQDEYAKRYHDAYFTYENKYLKSRDPALTIGIGLEVLGAIGLTAFGLTFAF